MLFFEGCGRHGAALSVIVRRGLAALTVYTMQWRKHVRWIWERAANIVFRRHSRLFSIDVFAGLPVSHAEFLSRKNACILRLRLSGLFPYFLSRQA